MSRSRWQLLVALLIPLAHAEETTTNNLINDYGWTPSGGVLDHYNHHHTDWTGGSVSQIIDISAYEGQTSYNYNTDVYACENRIGGHCGSGTLDTFTVTLTLDTGEQWVNTYAVGNQWEEIDITYTPTTDATTAELTLYGADNGYWAGWYGPVFYSGSFTVTFDPTLTEVIMPAANPELNTVLPADPMSDPSMGMSVPDLGPVEVPTVTVEIQTPVVQPVQQTQPTQPTQQGQPSGTNTPGPSATASNDSGSNNSGGGSSNKSSGKVSVRTAAGVVSANIDTANASAQSIGNAFGDPSNPVAQAVMVAVMAAQGAELEDAKLTEPQLPKARKITQKRFKDRFWLDSMRSEARFQKHMVDKQWQK
jgi:hypothetical protein